MSKPEKIGNNYRIRWVDAFGVRQCETLGSRKDAHLILLRKKLEASEQKRGLKKLILPKITFEHACEYYLAFVSPQKRDKTDKSVITKHLQPFFGHLYLNEVGNFVDEYKISKSILSPKTVHNQLTLLGSILKKAKEKGWLGELPKIKKPKITICQDDFLYLRSKEEMNTFLSKAKEESQLAYTVYAVAMYAGMREGEVAGLRRTNIDLEKRIITVKYSYDGPTKNTEIRRVPILDPLLPILTDYMKRTPVSEYFFTNEWGNPLKNHSRIFHEVLHRVLDKCGFDTTLQATKAGRYINFHALRHTFCSHWMANGGPQFKLQRIVGHKSHQMTERYSHLAPNAFESDHSILG